MSPGFLRIPNIPVSVITTVSVLRYEIQVWGQQRTQIIKEIQTLQEKAIKIMDFKNRNEPTNPLFKKLNIMKLKDTVSFCLTTALLFLINSIITCLKISMTFS